MSDLTPGMVPDPVPAATPPQPNKALLIKVAFAGLGVLLIGIGAFFGIEIPYARELVCSALQ